MESRSRQSCWSLQSEPDVRRAHKCSSGAGLLIDMRKGEPKVVLDWPANIQGENARGPELPHATCTPSCTLPAGSTLPRTPDSCAPIQFKDAEASGAGPNHGPAQSHRVGDSSGYAVGAWGNLCKAELPSEGQTAAHGQITERKPSVSRFRFFLAQCVPPWKLYCGIAIASAAQRRVNCRSRVLRHAGGLVYGDSIRRRLPRSPMRTFNQLIARLKQHYGASETPPAKGPFELVLWENACYLLPDERRLEVFEAVRALKVWFTLKVYGTEALGASILRRCAPARALQ